MLSGQIIDAFGTISVGYLTDRTKTRIGQRKPWYIKIYKGIYLVRYQKRHLLCFYFKIV